MTTVPDVTYHGVWVKLTGTTRYGRIAYVDRAPEFMVYDPDSKSFDLVVEPPHVHVVWENKSKGKFTRASTYVYPEYLEILPVEPEPWYANERQEWLKGKAYMKTLEMGLDPTI